MSDPRDLIELPLLTKIVGAHFRERETGKSIKAVVAALTPEESPLLSLERQPTNAFDENAIKVMMEIDGEPIHLGYIPRDVAESLAPALDAGLKVSLVPVGIGDGAIEIFPREAE